MTLSLLLSMIPWIINIATFVAPLGVALYYYMKYQHSYWERRGIPSLPGHWFFGNAKDAVLMRTPAGDILGQLHQQAKEEHDVMGIYILHRPFLLLRNPEIIKQILIKDFHIFPNRYFSANSISDLVGSTNLFTIDNPEWKHLRVKMSPVFTSGKVKRLFELMVETSKSMEEFLQNQFNKGSETVPIKVKDSLSKYTNDVISSLAFGIRSNSFSEPVPEFYVKSQEGLRLTSIRAIRFFCMFFFPLFSKYLGGQMLGPSTNYFRKVFWESMKSREATKTKRGDLIDSLLELKNEKQETDFKFEGDVLLAQSAVFFIAGRETTISTMTFALCELAKNPDIQTRVREEILEKIKPGEISYEAVQDLKYLNQVISETLRLYPPAPLLDRVAVEDYKIPGTNIVIEKGVPVYVSLNGIHCDARYHPDPYKFDPDRFSEERKSDMKQCSYMPFGDGPRLCIGMRVGMLVTAVGLITILSNYKVSVHPRHTHVIDPRSVFTTPPEGYVLNFSKIS